MTLNFQNYKHFKIPITINPLEYGKLIFKIDNYIISQINRTNIALIHHFDELNHVKIFKEGDFLLEYKDHITNENTFVRSLNNKKFTFINNELSKITTDKIMNAVYAVLNLKIIIKILTLFPDNELNIMIAGFYHKNIKKQLENILKL
jgi:hypothetical protein